MKVKLMCRSYDGFFIYRPGEDRFPNQTESLVYLQDTYYALSNVYFGCNNVNSLNQRMAKNHGGSSSRAAFFNPQAKFF